METKVDIDLIAQGVRMILEGIGEDPERAGLRGTPRRVAEMYAELTRACAKIRQST
jgi:GTP cyclohydrolase I